MIFPMRSSWQSLGLGLSILLVVFGSLNLYAQREIPPNPNRLVSDYANMLSPQEEAALTNKLNAYARETSTQIAIVTERSLEGEDIFDYSFRLAQEWGIGGNGENDNGILIYVALEDRDMYIQTGYGAEGFLPDNIAKRVIENVITPAFREGQYYEGLSEGAQVIMDLGKGEYTNTDQRKRVDGGPPAFLIIIILIVLIIIFSNLGGGDDDDGGYYRGGRYDMDRRRSRRGGGGWIFLPGPGGFGGGGGGGWDSGGGGGFGGGGFGGFGGGDFGGGGAGGSW